MVLKLINVKWNWTDAIRTLGHTKVPVKLHHEVTATLNVHVKEVKNGKLFTVITS